VHVGGEIDVVETDSFGCQIPEFVLLEAALQHTWFWSIGYCQVRLKKFVFLNDTATNDLIFLVEMECQALA
jgi:hypothetical protein